MGDVDGLKSLVGRSWGPCCISELSLSLPTQFPGLRAPWGMRKTKQTREGPMRAGAAVACPLSGRSQRLRSTEAPRIRLG